MQHLDTKPIIPEPDTPHNPFNGLVSIIIPTFNCAQTLPVSIRSLQNQSYKNIEIIVSDDGSTDDTKNAVADLGVDYIYQEVNAGAAGARNAGAKKAGGEILMFAEADGYYDPDYVEKIIRYMHLPGVAAGINLGRVVWTDRDTALVRLQNDLLRAAGMRVERGTRGTGAWAFHKKPFWEVGGYDPECRIGEDMDLVRRVVRECGRTVAGGWSTLYHKDPDTLKKLWRRAYRGAFFSGRFQGKWKNNDSAWHKILYTTKFAIMAAAPLYLIAAFFTKGLFAAPFLAVLAYLLLEDPSTALALKFSWKRKDLSTFLMTPVFLYIRRMAIGWGRVRSFFAG
jgi:glycosyltransferase involved in cell wall biosynthesis